MKITTLLPNNVSDKYKFEWIAPERTGSRQVAEILSYYGFKNNGISTYYYGSYRYNHRTIPNEKYSDYKVICNARNPYGRVYSLFKNFYRKIDDKSQHGFKDYLINHLPILPSPIMVTEPKSTKSYDYIIRLEYMKEDLMKLPFILDVLTESQIDIMISHGREIDNWEEFYDDEMKEIVYSYTSHHFKLWGYEK
jgi:hypothetical protein